MALQRQERADILVVDDEPEIRSMVVDVLSNDFRCQSAANGEDAFQLAGRQFFDIIISDIAMPNMSGLELLDKVRTLQPTPKVVLMTSVGTMQSARQAIRRGAFDYIRKPFDLADLKRIVDEAIAENDASAEKPDPTAPNSTDPTSVMQLREQFGHLQTRLRQTCMESIMGFVAAVEAKDPFTERHSRRVAAYAVELAKPLGLDADRIETVETAALLHDIGKIGIPDHILVKPGKLTPDEFALVKMHPEMGHQILEHISFLQESLPLVLHHHERWDGGGYPAGLAEEAIPFGARILHVADAVDAMLSQRSYKPSMTLDEVIAELELNRGKQFDPRVTDVALRWAKSAPSTKSPTRSKENLPVYVAARTPEHQYHSVKSEYKLPMRR